MMRDAIQEAHSMLDQLAAGRFYGTIAFQFKDRQVMLIRREETILPSVPNGKTEAGYERKR